MKPSASSNFPDQKYLHVLIRHLEKKVSVSQTPLEKLIMLSGASMNWIADYVTDPNVSWELETLPVDNLYLTGTGPKWNKIIIDQCQRSPLKLREFFKNNSSGFKLFSEAKFNNLPILVRYEEGKYKVLDGMHRTIAAIRDGKKHIKAFVARLRGNPKPLCEPHVVYDLLKSYHRKVNHDRQGLITAIRFLRHSFSNVDDLLRNRFTKSWVPDDEIQLIIQAALKD